MAKSDKKADVVCLPNKSILPDYYPRAVLWKLLVRPVDIKDTTEGGIALPGEAQRAKGLLRYFGQVVDMGPLCYRNVKFADETGAIHPACKVGDWIAFGQYAGQQIPVKVPGKKEVVALRLLSDDEVMAVVPDPDVLQLYCD